VAFPIVDGNALETTPSSANRTIAAVSSQPWERGVARLEGTMRRTRPGVAAFAIIASACALVLWPPRPARHDLRITVIDVGQGDAILVQTPRGHAILIDAGGKLERGTTGDGGSVAEAVGERIVVPFLIRQGIHHVDAILLTHPHGDHVGGVAPILRRLGAEVFFDGGQAYGGHAYRDALEEARRRHVRIVAPRAGDLWRTDDGVSLRFLTSSGVHIDDPRDRVNENSLVAMLECPCGRPRPFRALFMGDAGKVSEAVLLAHHVDLRADVLKVGHHGSRYASSPAFLAAVGAHDAIISDGRHNLYHHPAPETLAALAAAHMRVWRTDLCGAIVVSVWGGIRITPTIATCPSIAAPPGFARLEVRGRSSLAVARTGCAARTGAATTATLGRSTKRSTTSPRRTDPTGARA
jgi:competence protein ComEC